MTAKKHLFYCDVIVTVPVTISVSAIDDQKAFAKLMNGAWHSVTPNPKDWSKASVTHIGEIKMGPGIN